MGDSILILILLELLKFHFQFLVSMFPLSFQKAYFKSNIHHGMTPSTWWDIQKVLTLFARLSLNGSTLIVICVSFERFIGNKIIRDRIFFETPFV